MNHSKLNKIMAIAVFFISLATYIVTLADTVVFWDVGEFIAAAYSLQVPHPPGSPFFLLIGKIFSMIPIYSDIAVRVHFISALSSAFAAMFLYLIIEKLISSFQKKDPETFAEKLAVYGAGLIGALSCTFSPTFWFNAVEAEVYGLSMMFVGGITYLALRWNERSDEAESEKYILLIAYLIGLSIGIHLLAILVLFPFMLIFYFRKYEFSINSFAIFGVIAVGIFFIVYPGIVKYFPILLKNESTLISSLPLLMILTAIYLLYYAHKNKKTILSLASMSFLLIILGYSTYTLVIIRANMHTPMNENDPSNMERLVSYVNREQYGDAPIIKRRHSQEPMHQEIYNPQKYRSDGDYFFKYQINHMYIRYFLWNFAGIEGDWQDAGVNWKQLWAIPLFLGFFGMFYHYKKDGKMFFVFLNFFLLMGLILAYYFNMQEPQPRERDYFYVGSFFIFSVWIGLGVLGMVEFTKNLLKSAKENYTTGATIFICFLLVPANMFRTNLKQANRSGDYVAWDYSYNLLQSCEKDAILFTNGDNDTFPLWYLQDVEGVRRDIRIVNLSLGNTPWYIKQLKHEKPYGALPVPLSLSDEQIESIQPMQWKSSRLRLPVPIDATNEHNQPLTAEQKNALTDSTGEMGIDFNFNSTMNFGEVTAIRVQDILTFDIVMTNNWKRPIYFAVTSSPDTKIGLDKYMRMDGLALKLIPVAAPTDDGLIVDSILAKNLLSEPKVPNKKFERGFRFRGLQDETVYYNENVRRLISNYRNAFVRLSLLYINNNQNNKKAIETLDKMEEKLPRKVTPMDEYILFDIATFYNYAGAKDKYEQIAKEVEGILLPQTAGPINPNATQRNPFALLLSIYESRGDFGKAIDILNKLKSGYSGDQNVLMQIDQKISQLQTQKTVSDLFKKDSLNKK